MQCPTNRSTSPTFWPKSSDLLGRKARNRSRLGPQAMSRCAHRSDIHEEPSVKTRARRLRNFPNIHSASSAERSAMSDYAVAPIHTVGIALRHVGPRDAT